MKGVQLLATRNSRDAHRSQWLREVGGYDLRTRKGQEIRDQVIRKTYIDIETAKNKDKPNNQSDRKPGVKIFKE